MKYKNKMISDVLRVQGSGEGGQRNGQILYNFLPVWVQNEIIGTVFDPYEQQMNYRHEILQWISRHLTFNKNGQIIEFRDYEKVLYVKEI